MSSNDVVAELFMIATLYLFKSSFKKNYENLASPVQEFEKSPILSPENAEKYLQKGKKIIVEGIVHSDKPLWYKYKNPFPTNDTKIKEFKLVTLIKIKDRFFYNPFDLSSKEYYGEANMKTYFKNRRNAKKTVSKVKEFLLKDYYNPNKFAIIENKAEDEHHAFDFLNFSKKYSKFDLSVLLRINQYGVVKKHLGVVCGSFLGVYGEFEKINGELVCRKPSIFFQNRDQVVKEMKKKLMNAKVTKDISAFIAYVATFVWILQKTGPIVRRNF